ncbi:MAG TPA: nuclear transport factor 2 family protein [Bryobacteraceae bacterium]|nr:nuclear transport factor 2 family protein [Bryobacteraceae bacterium]
MKCTWAVWAFALAASAWPVVSFAAAPSADEQKAIMAAEDQWRDAGRAYDADKLDQVMSDDCIMIDASGGERSKADYLKAIRAVPAQVKSGASGIQTTRDNLKIRVYGNVAVVTGIDRGKTPTGTTFATAFTHVWVNDQGHWRLSTFHASRVATPLVLRPAQTSDN